MGAQHLNKKEKNIPDSGKGLHKARRLKEIVCGRGGEGMEKKLEEWTSQYFHKINKITKVKKMILQIL